MGLLQNLSWIHNSIRIKEVLDLLHQGNVHFVLRVTKSMGLLVSNTVLSGDRTTVRCWNRH